MTIESVPGPRGLSDAEMRIVAEVAIEMARAVSEPFNTDAMAVTFARAALKDAGFKGTLAATHRSILVKRAVDPNNMLAPLAPLFRDLQQKAERVLEL